MQGVRAGIPRLELGEKLERSLVGSLFEAFDHSRPMLAEDFWAASTGSVAAQAIGLGPDDQRSDQSTVFDHANAPFDGLRDPAIAD